MTESGVRIRPVRPGEREALTELVLDAKRHWGYPEDLIELWRDDLAITPEVAARCEILVAERDGVPVGVAAVNGADGELEHLWVRPRAMGEGIGRRLFERAVRIARDAGAAALTIVSDPNAAPFYEHLGARRVGLVPSKPAGRELPRLTLDL